MADRYALIGHPVSQSVSPAIHAKFAELTRQDMSYELLDVEPERFEQAVAAFRADGGKGLNVTLPHKTAACAMADKVSARAQAAQAANTLIFDAESADVFADNTDGLGLVRDLQHHQFQVAGCAILIVGAGGACRGIIQPLLEAQAREIVVVNRTSGRAERMVDDMVSYVGNAVRAVPIGNLATVKCDALINATAASLDGQVPSLPGLNPDALAWGYDLAYAKGDAETAFVDWLRARGVRAQDGYGMLVEQAAESFYLWRGVRPPTTDLRAARR